MLAERKQTRPRTAPRRQQGAPPHKDAVLSAMLAQITICLILLALAYCLKISGLPLFQGARAAAERVLGEELPLGAIDDVLLSWNLQLPAILPSTGQLTKEAEPPAAKASASAEEPPPVESEHEDESSAIIDSELAGYMEQYLPKEDGTTSEESIPQGRTTDADLNQQPLNGQGGGFHSVRPVGAKKRLSAPAAALLSPFFISDKPVLPVKLGTLTGNFGYRKHPITGVDDFHTGVDIAAPAGTPISAVLDGVVSESGVSAIYGNYIVLKHSMGLETAYCHCSELLAPMGAVVRQREVIAKVGTTGMSTGNHVHLEFRLSGLRANPAWVYDEF